MAHEDRWAAAFTGVLGEDAEEGLCCLQALVPPIKAVSGALFGYTAARRLENLLRESAAGTAISTGNGITEYAIRFVTLTVEKNVFKNIDMILFCIEKQVDARKGTLAAVVESAAPIDAAFSEELRRDIARRTGAPEVTLRTRVVPDLLGGYRLRIGGLYVDASLKGQMEKMLADLETAVLGEVHGGI